MKIIADMHTHTVASTHAYSTIKEMAEAARDAGLEYWRSPTTPPPPPTALMCGISTISTRLCPVSFSG